MINTTKINIITNNSTTLPKTPLFGTDGIRGQAGQLLTAPFALKVGACAGEVLTASAPAPGPIILGQDSRNSSDMLAMAIAAGLTSVGMFVWYLGICPTPCVSYLVNKTEAIGGIMISASHNPPEDNGIKFFTSNGMKLSKSLSAEMEARLRDSKGQNNGAIVGKWGKYDYRRSLIQNYEKLLRDSLGKDTNFQGMRIVLDLAWGASVETGPTLFKQLGAEVICLHDLPDGDRINVNCGSTNLGKLQEAVLSHHADLGFAFDGDADRVMAVDNKGRVVNGDYILYLWGKSLKEQQQLPGDLIVATVMANLGFERAWEKLGGKLIRTPVGDQHVQAQMGENGGMLGGEQSGHVICYHYSFSGVFGKLLFI